MATISRASTRTSLQLPRPIEPIKPLASEPCGPQTANLPLPAPTLHLFARAACSKQRRPPQPNLHSPNSRPAVQCNEGFCNARDGQRLTLTTSMASQKPHNYAQGRSPTKTRCRTATSAVNKRLSAPKPCTQLARAAFNPARMVNFDLRRVHTCAPVNHKIMSLGFAGDSGSDCILEVIVALGTTQGRSGAG
jgi:hypothetical protein